MGTTGGDRKKLVETIEKSDIPAVVVTNFSTPVVIFQEMIRFAGKNFPGALKGFKLLRKESHQSGKKDPSGTMIASQNDFSALLGEPVTTEQIMMVRDPLVQELELGISQQYLGGHGFHTYTLVSPDGTVELQFSHNILGRNTYIPLQAIRFLAARRDIKGKVFYMVYVLRAG
jgi:4-hydroxy-tetrahydrodipicolinate reductase